MAAANEGPAGIALMILTALLVSLGQLCWKLSHDQGLFFLLTGFILYIIAAVLMLLALRRGRLSVLHPLLSASYIFGLLLGYFVLHEQVGAARIGGSILVLTGIILICSEDV